MTLDAPEEVVLLREFLRFPEILSNDSLAFVEIEKIRIMNVLSVVRSRDMSYLRIYISESLHINFCFPLIVCLILHESWVRAEFRWHSS